MGCEQIWTKGLPRPQCGPERILSRPNPKKVVTRIRSRGGCASTNARGMSPPGSESGAVMDQAVDVEVARAARSVNASTGFEVRSTLYLAGLGLVAVYFLVWPIWRAQFPLEIWYTEGWNAYLQDAAGALSKLYP